MLEVEELSLTQTRTKDNMVEVSSIPGLIQLLEANRENLDLEYYSVSPTTLDEVFLRVVGEEEEEEKGNKKGLRVGKWKCW